MAKNLTTSAATVVASNAQALFIQVNAALTGTITITAAGSTQYGTGSSTIATITNPTVGNVFRYGGLAQVGAITVTPSTTCDITVTMLDHIN